MEAEIRRARRRLQAVMVAAFGLAVLPSVVAVFFTGEWIGLGRQVLFVGLAGAFVYTGAEWARWGLSLWFGVVGLTFFLAGFVGAGLSMGPSMGTVAPQCSGRRRQRRRRPSRSGRCTT